MMGYDIELVVKNTKTGNLVLPHEEGGISRTSHPVPHLLGWGASPTANNFIHTDGFALEINPSPGTCRGLVFCDILSCLRGAKKSVEAHYGAPVTLLPLPIYEIPPEIFNRAAPETTMLGCQEEWNAYTGEVETAARSVDPNSLPFRSCGGHFHFSLLPINRTHEVIRPKIKRLDATVGILATLLTPYPKLEVQRRQYYGRAGTYRIQPHGYEYRAISNFYMIHPTIQSLLHLIARNAESPYWEPAITAMLTTIGEYVENTINYCDVKQAIRIYEGNRVLFNSLMRERNQGRLDKLIFHGLLHYFKEQDVLRAWDYGNPTTDHHVAYDWEDGLGRFVS